MRRSPHPSIFAACFFCIKISLVFSARSVRALVVSVPNLFFGD